jgi:hypothetical protein
VISWRTSGELLLFVIDIHALTSLDERLRGWLEFSWIRDCGWVSLCNSELQYDMLRLLRES